MKLPRLLVLVLLTAACEGSPRVSGPNCTDIGVPALTLIAHDARTRQSITSRALVIARDGAYADTAIGFGTPPLYGMAYNRPGTYDVTVQLTGYLPWRIEGVVVPRGECNVSSIPLAASLVSAALANTSAGASRDQ